MSNCKLTIGFVRRGYSASGGAESYLKRLARGIVDLGHSVQLFTTNEWPPNEWPFGSMTHLRARSTIGFADELKQVRPQSRCDVLMSLERVWSCDVYRAGDGVHRAWLERRKNFATSVENLFRAFNRKHTEILRLEKALLADRGARRVIVNSQMVKDEIVDLYDYLADNIDIVRNGVPLDQFRFEPEVRAKARADLKLEPDEIAVLFAGSGWERKGLRFAIDAVEACRNPKIRLLIAGRGNQRKFRSSRAEFLGELADLAPVYAASDIFILPTIYDPFSNACLEALASGIPVISTRANGFSEVIEHGVHGSIVDGAGDIASLREAIQFWSDPSRRSAARSTIVERASGFDISKNVEQTLAILLQVAAMAAST
ncbi:MAG TPA: glycosyltransferase family 4 protein [Chthoniobacterales bacterium]|nr:glycosyltransferase family 4 protein [Chthoniobacterales bacterium]